MAAIFQRMHKNARTLYWALVGSVALLASVGLVMMFLLAQASNNNDTYERYYQHLFIANLVVAGILLSVLLWLVWRLWLRLRRGKFGSRLLLKFALVFALVATLPGALLYTVAYQFVTRAIESWFDVKVETALRAGLTLGRNVLDTLIADTSNKTQAAAGALSQTQDLELRLVLERLRSQQNAEQLVVWQQNGQQIATATGAAFVPVSQPPSARIVEALQIQSVVVDVAEVEAVLDSSSDQATTQILQQEVEPSSARIVAYSLVKPAQFGFLNEAWVLQLVQLVPPDLLRNAAMVQTANRDYQERALARVGMKRMFVGTLTLTLFLAVFGAILLASLLAAQIARPLLYLAEGVRQVAQGDLRPKHIDHTRDELGGLTRDFAKMTQQLADTRQALTTSMAELDTSRVALQTILDHLTSGVLVLDDAGTVLLANPSAGRILRLPYEAIPGMRLYEHAAYTELADMVQQQFDATLKPAESALLSPQIGANEGKLGLVANQLVAGQYWQHTMDLHTEGLNESLQTDAINLLLRGALLPEGASVGSRLLVLEDISAIVSAQRAQAWTEVARRLAHEIKNPLTPIQLSAERLEMKLKADLPDAQQAVLTKSVATIVQQVDAMKRLVNEFRDYARLPNAKLQPLDLNALISDVLQLYQAETAEVPIQAELDTACQMVLADAEQMRQIIHNLLQNAQDAQQQAGCVHQPVLLQTQWRPATQRVRLSVSDSGTGFPEYILQRAFEPYITSKARGTGLGLAVVKKIADEHGARISISNRVDEEGAILGAQVNLLLPTQEKEA